MAGKSKSQSSRLMDRNILIIIGLIVLVFGGLAVFAFWSRGSLGPRSPRVTAPGGEIAFSSMVDTGSSIYTINSDGTNLKKITNSPPTTEDGHPAWSKDNWQIAFETSRDAEKSENENITHQVYVMEYDGSNQRSLTKLDGGVSPAWSPDGKHIVFSSTREGNSDIYIMDTDGSNVKRLTNEVGYCDYPAWSPDGSKIVFAAMIGENWDIYTINVDGSSLKKLTDNIKSDLYPAWSPDGKTILFNSIRDGDWEIYSMNPDGSNQTNITKNRADDEHPAWSPDGKKIAFISDRDGHTEIYTMDPDGTNVQKLTTTDSNQKIWAVDWTKPST